MAGAAFVRWREMTCEARKQRHAMGKAMGMWKNRVAGAAFVRWREMTFELKTQRVAVQRTVGRWMNRRLSAAFARWTEFTGQVLRMQRLLERSAQRMQHREIFMALDALRWTVQEARRQRCAISAKAPRAYEHAWFTPCIHAKSIISPHLILLFRCNDDQL